MRRAAPLSRITSPRAPVTTTARHAAQDGLELVTLLGQRVHLGDDRVGGVEQVMLRTAHRVASFREADAVAGVGHAARRQRRRVFQRGARASVRLRGRESRRAQVRALLPRRPIPADAAPVAASTTRNIAAGARPIPIAAIRLAVGVLSKRFGLKRYPTLRTVRINSGLASSRSICWRRRRTCTSTVRGSTNVSRPTPCRAVVRGYIPASDVARKISAVRTRAAQAPGACLPRTPGKCRSPFAGAPSRTHRRRSPALRADSRARSSALTRATSSRGLNGFTT